MTLDGNSTVYAGITFWRAELPDGRWLVELTQDGEPAAPENITGIQHWQTYFGVAGQNITIMTFAMRMELQRTLESLKP